MDQDGTPAGWSGPGGPPPYGDAEWRKGLALALSIGIVIPGLLVAAFLVWTSGGDNDDDVSFQPDSTTAIPDTTDTTDTTAALSTCEGEELNPTNAEDPDVLEREPPVPEPPPASTPPDTLEVDVLIEGNDPVVECGRTVEVHYVGVLADGTVFDSSWETGQTFPYIVGTDPVIAGWEEGLIGARLGERRRILMGSDYAYGAQGSGTIPPNSPLAFDVDIVAID